MSYKAYIEIAKEEGAAPVPRRLYAILGLVVAAAVLAAFSAVTPWYAQGGTISQPNISTTYVVYFTPGPAGYTSSCITYYTGHFTACGNVGYPYSTGSGSEVLSELYLWLLGATVALAVLSVAGIAVFLSGFGGRMRARRSQRAFVLLVILALAVAAAGAVSLPVLQGPALNDLGQCTGYNASSTPCNSFFGYASGVGCQQGTCVQTNLSWYPDIGWFLDLGAVATLGTTLLLLRSQPLGRACPSCGVPNRFGARFCDTCGNPLPIQAPPPTPPAR